MIKLVNKNDESFSLFCDKDVFGTRIKAYYNCYSTDYDFIMFWAQYDENNEITATLCRIDGNFTLCASNPNIDEIREFIRVVGFVTLQCDRNIAYKLTDSYFDWGYVVRCDNVGKYHEIGKKKFFELKEIYDIIKDENLTGVGELLPWLSDVTFRVNRKSAEGAITTVDGENAGCAMVLFRTDKAVILGAVATRPQFRGRGIARSIVLSLAQNELESGRRVELLCKNGTIVDFYKSIGFNVISEWGLINNESGIF